MKLLIFHGFMLCGQLVAVYIGLYFSLAEEELYKTSEPVEMLVFAAFLSIVAAFFTADIIADSDRTEVLPFGICTILALTTYYAFREGLSNVGIVLYLIIPTLLILAGGVYSARNMIRDKTVSAPVFVGIVIVFISAIVVSTILLKPFADEQYDTPEERVALVDYI